MQASLPDGFQPRVLLICEAANPEWTSGPLVGWSHSEAIARITQSHRVTQIRNREAFLRANLIEHRDFTAIDTERVAGRLHRLADRIRGGSNRGWTTMSAFASLSYYEFERQIWSEFGGRIRDREFDIVHRLTPISPAIPSTLARRCDKAGVPFIAGPMNGGLPWPKGFRDVRHRDKEWLSYARKAHQLLPGYRGTRRCAKALIIGSMTTWEQMPSAYREKCVYIPENAIDPLRFAPLPTRQATTPLRAAFIGRLVALKGVDMLLEAAAQAILSGRLELEIFGEGPERERLEQIVKSLGLGVGVKLRGFVPHQQLADCLRTTDLLVLPSIREFGGGVVLEAMAVGLVPIVIDYGGPGELVTDDTGYRIPLGTRAEMVDDLRALLKSLYLDPDQITARRPRARARILDWFTWDAKAAQVMEVYRWVLGERIEKPDFGMPIGSTPANPSDGPKLATTTD